MSKSQISDFHLETDDRTKEERSRQKAPKKDGLASALGMDKEEPKAPMDTDYQEDMEPRKPEIRFNLNFDKGIRGEPPEQKRDSSTFTIERLFEAVASRDPGKLDGLYEYLHRSMKKLSDSLYQSYGKTALMKALLHLKDGKNQTIDVLINISERIGDIKEFVNAAYTSSYYKGQTALHIAIERRSVYYVKLLVSKGAGVHAKACGKFFQPHDGPNFYFGELPLSLAACTNQPDIVDYLMENEYLRADATMTDSQGNTVLHALMFVADNTKENIEFIAAIYDRILKNNARLYPKIKLEEKENKDGLTPLKLAAKLGKNGIFSHILQREFQENHFKHLSRKFTEWVYGPVHSSLYDLSCVDSFEKNSVLEIIIYGSDIPNRHAMLETELLSDLLEDKWKKFGGRMFFVNFLIYLVYLSIFTGVAYNKRKFQDLNFWFHEDKMSSFLYASGMLFTLIANCYFFITGILDMKRKRPKTQTLMIDGYYEILFFTQGLLFLISTVLYVADRDEYLGFLVICIALSWVNVLYYSRGDRHMGVYSVMIQKMILSDIVRFLFVYLVYLFGFSAAVVTLLVEPEQSATGRGGLFGTIAPNTECVKPTYRNFSYTTMELFKFTIGMGDIDFTHDYKYMEVFYILLIGYIILTYILLLNMLIALMNRTVENITEESNSIWKLQRAVTILDMEKRLPSCLKESFRSGVEKKLGPALGDNRRRFFRVESVNWNKWNTNLVNISEDPGCSERIHQLDVPTGRYNRERSWRGFFMESRRRRMPSTSTELRPLNI